MRESNQREDPQSDVTIADEQSAAASVCSVLQKMILYLEAKNEEETVC